MSLIEQLEKPSGWERFVEGWWITQIDRIKKAFRGDHLPDDFLLYMDDFHGLDYNLFAEFGIVNVFYDHWETDYRSLSEHADISVMGDPTWGGLHRWKEAEREPVDVDLPFSPTTINQGNSLARNLHYNEVSWDDVKSAVHWGGGIGIQTLMMRRWGATHTEYIIDLPVMSAVQYEWLSHNYDGEVRLALDDVREGAINLVPLSRVELVPRRGHDLFIALHSLNESTEFAQGYVTGLDWFGADKLILEWTDDHPYFLGASHWGKIVKDLEDKGRILPRRVVRMPHYPSPGE